MYTTFILAQAMFSLGCSFDVCDHVTQVWVVLLCLTFYIHVCVGTFCVIIINLGDSVIFLRWLKCAFFHFVIVKFF